MNGVINIYKEAGYTSHDVVARLRGILKQRKIGHTGTLDPDAEGVLPVCIGSATKLCGMLADETKDYEAVLLLGVETDTQDMSGRVIRERPADVTEQQAEAAVLSFLGDYEQIPPMYSALKMNGRKLYELAREGKTVERRARQVHIYDLRIINTQLPRIRFSVTCSKGTYIRTLCHDIGSLLGTGGAMEKLTRTRAGSFCLEQAYTLDRVEAAAHAGEAQELLIPVDRLFDCKRAYVVKAPFLKMLQNGNVLVPGQITGRETDKLADARLMPGEQIRIYDEENRFYGIYAYRQEEGCLKPVKMFLEQG